MVIQFIFTRGRNMNLKDGSFVEDIDPNQLLKATKTCIISVENEADMLETKFESKLKPVLKGFYKFGSMYPLGPKEVNELLAESKRAVTALRDISSGSGIEVINNRSKLLFEYPTVPSRGLKLIELCICDEINRINPYKVDRSVAASIERMFLPNAVVDLQEVAECCNSIVADVLDFVGEDVWHIYNVSFNRTDLIIERTVDYRIYDWHLQRFKNIVSDDEVIRDH